jgi:hypothetical protein
MENINKRRRIILNRRQKIQNVSHKETRIIEHENQINKNIKFSFVNSSESNFNINLTSIQPSNNLIADLSPVIWVDSSDLTSLLRDNKNNVYQILDKSGNNNHLYQSTITNQPKYHNGNLLFNGNQYLTTTNTFTQTINNMSIFIVLKQYNQSSTQGIISGLTATSENDNTDANSWALFGSDGSTYQYEFNSNSNILLNSSNINTTLPFGIYEIIINSNAAKLYYNGTLINSSTFSGLGTFTKLLVGSRYTSSTFNSFFQGEVSEILIFNSALSTGNRYKVEKYLLNKWQTTQIPRTIPLSNIYTWLDASSINNFIFDTSNNLIGWKDMNSRMNFTQTNTTYSPLFKNNKVLFNNSSLTCIDNVGLDLNNFSMFMVFEQVAHANNARVISCINTIGETDTSVANGFTVLTNATSNLSLKMNSGTLTYTDTDALLSKKLYEFVVTNGVGVVYVNGVQQATTSFGNLGIGLRFTLGAKQNTTSNPFNGYMYELIILNTGDNYSERNQIYGYLSEKWNLPITSSKPAPYQYMWLDSNNSSSITVDGSNNITAWNDISPNNFTVTLSGTNPVLQTLNGLQSAYFTGSKLELTGGFTGSNATFFLVFSANISLASNSINLLFFTGDYTSGFNTDLNKSALAYEDGTIVKNQTILFNNTLNILSIRYINNVANIYINNYLINTFSTPTWNFTNMGFSAAELWVGNIPEFIFYNNSLDFDSYTGTMNYLSSKWQININTNLVNEYIPRAVTSTTKSIALTTKSSTTNDTIIGPFTIIITYDYAGSTNETKAYYSYDGINYNLISSLNTIFSSGTFGGGVAWNGSIWLACTYGSPAFASSSDGITWTSVSTSPSFTSSINNFLTWGNDKWILGANNGISYSYDSLNWTTNTILTNCYFAKYNPKTFLWVAGGTGDTYNLVYSTNGINWTGSTSGTSLITNFVNSISCNDSMWVASGVLTDNSTIIIYSFDGISWIKSISGTNVVTNCASIVWNGKMWVAVGSVIGYSYDGINWLPTNASGTNLTWNGLIWTTGTKYSNDGINWTNISGSIINAITNISAKINQPYRKNVNFLAILINTASPNLLYSYNGISWFPSPTFTENGSVLYYNNNIWIGGGVQTGIFYSFDGINWTSIGINPLSACISVDYYNNLWIAGGGGANITMASSTNGIKWTAITDNPFTNNCYAIKNNGTLWVAGGGVGDTTLAYSTNGTTWNASTSGSTIFDTSCQALAWNGSIWVAGGQSNTYSLATSTDGMSWTGVTTDFTRVYTVKYGNNLFVAGGLGPTPIKYSTNGTTWTASQSATDIIPNGCYSLSWNGTIWVASGDTDSFAYSYDGINWLLSLTIGGHYNMGVGYVTPLNTSPRTVYSNNNFTILASQNSSFYSYYYYSFDGINYSVLTSLNSLLSTTLYGGVVGWNGTSWLACATTQPTGFFASSTDGINWSLITTTPSTINMNPSALGWGKDKWVMGDAGGGFGTSYSYDAITWTPITGTIASANLKAIKWNGTIWIAVGDNSGTFNLYYSYDGITWTGSQSALNLVNGPLYSVAYSDSLWVVGGLPQGSNTNSIIYSYDGINWFPSTSAFSIFTGIGGNLLVYNGSIWVAGYGFVIAYSYDGINWIISTSGVNLLSTYGINALEWNGSVFIAEIYGFGIMYSYDGINWSLSSSSVTNVVIQIASQTSNFIYKKNTNYISIADTTNNSTKFNLNAPVPISQTLTNQLTVKSTDPVYLTIVDKNVIYNLSEFVSGSSIVLPTLPYDSDYFAFINNGSYDLTITGPNSLSIGLPGNLNQVRYFTNTSGTFSSSSTFQGFTCTLNQYTNAVPTFTVYLGGWSQSLNYIKRLYIFDGTTLIATTYNIYYGLTYQADFTFQYLATGTYTFTVSDTFVSTGNIISFTLTTPVVYTQPAPTATLDHYNNGISQYVITFTNFFPTVTTVDIWSSINSDYSSGSYVTTSTTITDDQASFTYAFPPGYNYISIVDSTDSITINIADPIVIYSFIFTLSSTTHTSSKNIILDGWADIFTTNLTSLRINMYTTSNFSDTPITLTFPTSAIVDTSGVYTLPFSYFWDIGRYYYFKITDPSNFVNVPVSNYISPLTITGSISSSIGLTNTNNVYTITLSNPESYDLSLFLTNWDIYYANNNLSNTGILITTAPINSSQEITFSYNPGANNVVLYFYVGSTNIFTPPIRWLPTSISNCALWLDASLPSNFTFSSGLNIATWIDRSGNNVNITASNTSMTLTTDQVLFNGSNNYFTTTYPATNANETAFMVVSFNSLSGEQDLLSSSSTGDRKYYLNSGNISYENTDGSFVLTNGGSPTTSTTYIYEYSNNGTNINFYTNGSFIYENTGVYTLTGSGSTLIGGSTGYFNGTISEIIIYTSILTTNERQLVEGYLALKWGLEADLPNDHPFYNSTGSISPPTAPYSLTSSAISATGFTISWSGGTNATSYIYNFNGSEVTPSTDNGVSASNAEFSGLTLGTQYVVNVIAVNPFGTVNSIANLTVSTTFSFNYISYTYGAGSNITFVGNGGPSYTNNFTLIVNITDSNSEPVPGETVTITGDDGSSYTNGTDNNDGSYTFTVSYTTAISVIYTANDTTANISSAPVTVIYILGALIILKATDYSGSGTWNDQTVNANNATNVDGTIAKNSASNGIVLNGSTSWTFSNVTVDNAWTIGVWFKQTGSQTAAGASIVTQTLDTDKVNLTIGDVQGLNNGTYNGGFYDTEWYNGTDITLTTNEWTNIQVTWDGTDIKTYKNNTLLGTTTPGVSSVDSGQSYRIGRGWDDTTGLGYVTGEIGEVKIYDNALTLIQLTADYNNSKTTFSPTQPTSLSSSVITDTEFTINWTGGLNATSFTFTLNGSSATPTYISNNIATFTGLNSGTQYAVIITAVNSLNSSASNSFNVTTKSEIGVTTFAGSAGISGFTNGIGTRGLIDPIGIATDPATGNIYVTNFSKNSISKITPSGVVSKFSGLTEAIGSDDGTADIATFNFPRGCLVYNGYLYVCDNGNGLIRKVSLTDGSVTTLADVSITTCTCITIDSSGNFYIGSDGIITLINTSGTQSTFATSTQTGTASISGIAIDLSGNIYFTDVTYNSLRVLSPSLSLTVITGLSYPGGINFSSDYSTLYIASGNNQIYEYNISTGTLFILAGTGSIGSSDNSNLLSASFYGPSSSSLNLTGTILYVSDNGNSTIRKVFLTQPTNLTASNILFTEFTINWFDAIGATAYTYTLKNSSGNTIDPSTYTVVDNGLTSKSAIFSGLSLDIYVVIVNADSVASQPLTVSLLQLLVLLKAVDYSGSGTWTDQSGFNNNATKVDGTIAKNSADNGIVLNGSTSWTFPNVIVGNAWTVGVWFKQTGSATAAGASIVTQKFDSDKINLAIGDVQGLNNGTFNGGFYNSSGWSNGTNITLTTNLWTNIQVTWNGTNLKTYINTSLIGTTTPGGVSVDSGLAYSIGRGWDDTTGLGYVIGEIGEVRIYDAALTQTQVTSNYQSSVATFAIPSPITNLRSTSTTSTSIAISWSGGSGATSYSYTLNGLPVTPSTNNGMTNKTAIFTNLTAGTLYRINVIATNGNGSSGVGFDLNIINDNKMWLDGADPLGTGTPPSLGTVITTWSDKSGSGNNATGISSPTYSATGIVFNGTSQYFTTNYTASPVLETAFIVVKFNSVSGEQDLISGSELNDRQYLLFDSNISYTGIGVEITLDNGGSPSANITYLLEYLNDSTTTMNFYTNGALINANSEAYPLSGTGTTTIGAYLLSGTAGGFLNGTISEVIIYNKILTNSQRATLEGYLAWKWGLQSQLPSTHIYYNNKPTGNSIVWSDSNTPYSATNTYSSVCCTSSGDKIAVFSTNGIYTSLNAGATWTLQPDTTTWTGTALYCTPNGSILLASGQNTKTQRSTNFGVTWTEIDTLGGPSICCSDNGTKIAFAVSNGWIKTSTDSGANWTTTFGNNGESAVTVACSADGSVLLSGIYQDSVLISSDFGTNWTETSITVPSSGVPTVVCSPNGTTIYVSVSYNNGNIYKSTDSGATFNLIPNTPNVNWTTLSVSPNGLVLVGTESNGTGTWISLDAGVTWSKTLLWNRISYVACNYDGSQLIGVVSDGQYPEQNKIYKGINSYLIVTTNLTPPTAPTGLTTSNVTLTGFTVTWTGGNSATSYLYKFNGSNITPRVDNGVANKNATFTGITSGTYTLNVVAVNNGGSTNSSPTISITLGPIASFTILIDQAVTFTAFTFNFFEQNFESFLLKNMNSSSIQINNNKMNSSNSIRTNSSNSTLTFIIPINNETPIILNDNNLNISTSNNQIQLSYNNINATPILINNNIQNIITYINSNDQNLYSYLNGRLIAIDPINIIITSDLTTNNITFNTYALTNTERQLLEGNLAWELNINKQLPPTHPYYNVPPKSQITPETYVIQLNNWNSNITVDTLYLYDTQTNTLLTNITNIYGDDTNGYFASFTYQFSKAQNYLTISVTNMIYYDIPTPLIITPILTISALSNNPNDNWGYFNTSLIYSFTLQTNYIDKPVNYLNYYSTIYVYYADNSNFTNLIALNNLIINTNGNIQVSFTIHNPNISKVYFYFSYADSNTMNLDNTWISDIYYFIDRSSLNITLDHYTLITNLPFTFNRLYVFYSKDDPTYNSQQYLCSITNNVFTPTFTETGNYYLTITDVKDSEIRTINNINFNIIQPITITSLNPTNITYNIEKPSNTRINNSLIKLNSSMSQKEMYIFYSINNTNIKPLINPITDDNLYLVNNGEINIIPNITQDDNTITYFYGSSDKNYTTNIETYSPYTYINTNSFVLTVNNQTKTLNIANYNSNLNQPLYLLAKNTKNNTFINLEQTLLLDSNFNAKYNYDLPTNMIYTLIITDSFDQKNNPNGNIVIESHPIYTFLLEIKLNRNTIYTGPNTITMNINNTQITSGNLYIDDVPHPNNPFTIKNKQITFELIGNKDINLTFKTLDNNLRVTQLITYKPVEAILVENTIKLNNWNPLISSVDLYDNNEFINTFSVVYNKEYYIILNTVVYVNLQIKSNNILIPVSNPNNILIYVSMTNISVSPSTCSLNKSSTLHLSGVTHEYIYTSTTKYHSGKIGSGVNDLTPIINNNNKITITPTKLPLYIVTSPVKLTPTYSNTNTTFGLSNSITEDTNINIKITNINGSFDELNTFTVNLDIRYANIQIVNKDNNLIINHTIKDNNIIFSYDSGYEEKSCFNITNQVSNEIYEIIYVNYI